MNGQKERTCISDEPILRTNFCKKVQSVVNVRAGTFAILAPFFKELAVKLVFPTNSFSLNGYLAQLGIPWWPTHTGAVNGVGLRYCSQSVKCL